MQSLKLKHLQLYVSLSLIPDFGEILDFKIENNIFSVFLGNHFTKFRPFEGSG
jgi:hypothetical protein